MAHSVKQSVTPVVSNSSAVAWDLSSVHIAWWYPSLAGQGRRQIQCVDLWEGETCVYSYLY